MSIICSKCGRQLADNAKFCGGCGARIGDAETAVTPGVCPMCGATMPEGINFCTVCGTAVTGAQGAGSEGQEVTMDELIPPVITDDMFEAQGAAAAPSVESVTEVYSDPIFANAGEPAAEDAPTVDAVTDVYTDPIFANNNNVPKGYVPEPELTPEPESEPEQESPAVISEPSEPEVTVPETPVIDDSVYRQPAQPKPAQPTPQPQGYQQPSAVPYGYPQQPQHQPYPDPSTVQTKAGSSGGILVPIILIILILGVIAFDVFYLFHDRIFGSDDDSSKSSKEAASVITIADDL